MTQAYLDPERKLSVQEAFDRLQLKQVQDRAGNAVFLLTCGMCKGEEPITPAQAFAVLKKTFKETPALALAKNRVNLLCSHCTAKTRGEPPPMDPDDD